MSMPLKQPGRGISNGASTSAHTNFKFDYEFPLNKSDLIIPPTPTTLIDYKSHINWYFDALHLDPFANTPLFDQLKVRGLTLLAGLPGTTRAAEGAFAGRLWQLCSKKMVMSAVRYTMTHWYSYAKYRHEVGNPPSYEDLIGSGAQEDVSRSERAYIRNTQIQALLAEGRDAYLEAKGFSSKRDRDGYESDPDFIPETPSKRVKHRSITPPAFRPHSDEPDSFQPPLATFIPIHTTARQMMKSRAEQTLKGKGKAPIRPMVEEEALPEIMIPQEEENDERQALDETEFEEQERMVREIEQRDLDQEVAAFQDDCDEAEAQAAAQRHQSHVIRVQPKRVAGKKRPHQK